MWVLGGVFLVAVVGAGGLLGVALWLRPNPRHGLARLVPRRTYAGPEGALFEAAVRLARDGACSEFEPAMGKVAQGRRGPILCDAFLRACDTSVATGLIAAQERGLLAFKQTQQLDAKDDAVRIGSKYLAAGAYLRSLGEGHVPANETALMLSQAEHVLWCTGGASVGGFYADVRVRRPAQIVVTNMGLAALGPITVRTALTAVVMIQGNGFSRFVRLSDRAPLDVEFTDEADAWAFAAVVRWQIGRQARPVNVSY